MVREKKKKSKRETEGNTSKYNNNMHWGRMKASQTQIPIVNQQNLCKPQWLCFVRLMEQKFLISDKSETIFVELTLEGLLKRLKQYLENSCCPFVPNGFRLVGSAASSVISAGVITDDSEEIINDVDINIYIDNFSFFQILQCEEDCLGSFIEEQTGQMLSLRNVCDNFFREMIRVNTNEESWSLISIGNKQTNLDIRFIEKTKRSYAFSTDSFTIALDPILNSPSVQQSPNIMFESDYGNLNEAISHLKKKILKIKNPQEVRRGIFRVCLELSKGRRFDCFEEEQFVCSTFCQALYEEFQTTDAFQQALRKFLSKHQTNNGEFLNHLYRILANNAIQFQQSNHQIFLNCILDFSQEYLPLEPSKTN
jgi:hypothetical protein